MGAQDIQSFITNYGYWTSTAQQFIMADEMSNYTTRLYNEFVLNRDGIKPDYIVLFSDASTEVQENTLKAAAEFDIPVLKIDVVKLAKKQLKLIEDDIIKFQETGDLTYLGNAILRYETSASGFNLNNMEVDRKHINEHNSVRNLFNECKLKEVCLRYTLELQENGNVTEKNNFIRILQDIQSRYDNTNQRERVVTSIVNTKSMLNIKDLITILGDNL